jgi:GT2 family glycosyltransferase
VLVVTQTWNTRPAWLHALVDSLAAQDVPHTHVIGDDGSTNPETLAALRSICRRVRYFHRRGPGRGLINDLIRPHADHEYIAVLDHDDALLPGSLRARVDYLDAHPEVALVSHAGRCIGENGEDLGEVNHYGGPYYATRPPRFSRANGGWNRRIHYPPYHSACMYRRTWWERVGGYGVRPAKRVGDVGLFEVMLAAGALFTCLPDVLVLQRVWRGSMSFRHSPKRHRLLGLPWRGKKWRAAR